MGSAGAIGRKDLLDAADTIFVAVGKNMRESKSALVWALRSFPGKRICLLHVHQPSQFAANLEGKSLAHKLKQQAAKAILEAERQKLQKLLNQYHLFLVQEGVDGDKVWVKMNSIEKSIVEMVAKHNVRWLVMGAAADRYYSQLKEEAELKSKKAFFVCQHAPVTCHIWFTCNGCLIYTRRAKCIESEVKFASPMLIENPDTETEQLKNLKPETEQLKFFLPEFTAFEQSQKETDELSGAPGILNSQCLKLSNSPEELVDSSESTASLTDGDQALQQSCMVEINQRKNMEELLVREQQEVEKTKNQHTELVKELCMVQDETLALESQIAGSHHVEKDLEEKIIAAVDLLISMKRQRDQLQLESRNAIREVKVLKNLVEKDLKPQFLEFSFFEIVEATKNFDPSQKIGEGRYGSVFKGFLCHMQVAIKMLPSYGSKADADFQHEVEILSRVRHPNLVSLVGSCPESRSLVYEYLKNGCLEDHLTCHSNNSLSWQTRTRIAGDICSALLFLQSNNPCIVHGNLKPSKVLLDSNFVCKLGGLGIPSMLQHNQETAPECNSVNPSVTSAYVNTEIVKTGELSRESDVYSFGIILLQLLTGRPAQGIINDIKIALEKERLSAVLDFSAGDWPLETTRNLALLALTCCSQSWADEADLLLEVSGVLELMKCSSTASASLVASKENCRVPTYFMCPIFQDVMKDPQIAADGFTYEAEAIQGWFKSGHNTSPMTNLELENCNLHPNHALHYAIQEWLRGP